MGSSKALSARRYRAFLERLRRARLDAGLTQVEVAARVDRPQTWVSKCELGERRVDFAELEDLTAACGKQLTFFRTREKGKVSPTPKLSSNLQARFSRSSSDGTGCATREVAQYPAARYSPEHRALILKVTFLQQPFRNQVGTILSRRLLDPASNRFWFMSAWVQPSGIDALQSEIEAIRARGGTTECIVGVDHGSATREGLERVVAIMSQVSVFHDTGGRTFHPKVFVVEGTTAAAAIVGSANATGGGLYSNFESAVLLEIDRTDAVDRALLDDMRSYFDRFLMEPHACRRIRTSADIDRLVKDSRLAFATPSNRAPSDGADDVERDGATDYFGPPLAGLLRAPRRNVAGTVGAKSDIGVGGLRPESSAATRPSAVPLRWWKRLSRSDAQRKRTGHQRGSITLVQAGHNIDGQHYFHDSLFQGVSWVPGKTKTGETLETATVRFEVEFLGRSLGNRDLTITYALNREEGQRNYTTLLHLGPLARLVSEEDVTGRWLLLERRKDGSYGLSVLGTEPN